MPSSLFFADPLNSVVLDRLSEMDSNLGPELLSSLEMWGVVFLARSTIKNTTVLFPSCLTPHLNLRLLFAELFVFICFVSPADSELLEIRAPPATLYTSQCHEEIK